MPQLSRSQRDPVALVSIGRWLFGHRTWLPLPLALTLLLVRPGQADSSVLVATGAVIVALGELVRLWAVRHIGVISRTRSDRLGPVVSSGPFGRVRNPLYLGNILLWIGFALSARLPWMVPIVVLLLGVAYHAIVRWEEELLEARRGEEYRSYAACVPRWIPAAGAPVHRGSGATFSWRDTLFSERGTLLAIAAGYVLIWLKQRF